MKYVTQSSYRFGSGPTHRETPHGVSKTVQGDSYTITELFQKHISGQLPDIGRETIYNDQDIDSYDLEKLSNLDLAEKDEIKEVNLLRINQLKEKLEKKALEPIPEPEKTQKADE